MGIQSPYRSIEWADQAQHLTQLHVHEPRNQISDDSTVHEPSVDAELVPIDTIGKNNLSPASSPATLLRKYRHVGYTVFALTEHEYYVDREKHKDVAYEEMPDQLSQTSGPWSKWDVDPADHDVVALSGTELRGETDGTLHDLIGVDTDVGHGRQAPMAELLERIADQDGLAILPHPSKYTSPDEHDRYASLFEENDVLLGVEVFNANDRYPSRELWDQLLTEFGADRPVWAFAGDDYHGRSRPSDGKRFNRSRLVLLPTEHSKRAVTAALAEGRFYVQFNGDHHAPFVESIAVTDRTITVDAPAAERVVWIADGVDVASGAEISRSDVGDAAYVRAEIHGAGDAVSCTQPFYLT